MIWNFKRAIKFVEIILLLILCISIFVMTAHADPQDYDINGHGGKWKIKLKQNNLTNISSFELLNVLESDSDEAELTITTNVSEAWKVTVKRIDDVNWPDGLNLYIKRTGDREGIDEGQKYVLVSTTETEFFTGDLDEAKKIPIQFKLSGLASVLTSLTPKTKLETEIVYTITGA